MLRVGIHTAIRIDKPKIYAGTNKNVYILRVEGAESRQIFYDKVKTFKLKEYKNTFENNNRIVVPKKALQPHFNRLKQEYGGSGFKKPKINLFKHNLG